MVKNVHADVYAKTLGSGGYGVSVFTHCLTVGIICREYLKYLPKKLVDKYSLESFPLFAALHDLGKASPGFQLMLKYFMGDRTYHDLDELNREYCIRHEVTTAEHLLNMNNRDNRFVNEARSIVEMHRFHHGKLRSNDELSIHPFDHKKPLRYFGDADWVSIRNDIYNALVAYFGDGSEFIDTFNDVSVNSVKWKYSTGFLCVCDFLGSNEDLFNPDIFMGDTLDDELMSALANKSIIDTGLYADKVFSEKSFDELFGKGYVPTHLQSTFASVVNSPGLYVLESDMGTGKTEAALYASYKCREQDIVRGIYFGLPTQTTSNSMFTRFRKFVEAMTDYHQDDVRLVHANQELAGNTDSSMDPSWFHGNKKGTLSSYAVGTVDQALLSVLGNVKHFFLRTFGLANKCIILDEVHSYDVYTSELIKSMVSELVELECVVIVLSATLTSDSRGRLTGCYDDLNQYPLITKVTNDDVSYHFSKSPKRNKSIKIRHQSVESGNEFISSRRSTITECIKRVKRGEMVLWIENTIFDAQAVYDEFFLHLGDDVGSLHSRFTNKDRGTNEAYWVNLYGKTGNRLIGKIIVSTQVCEQSIDIDADFLVTSMCPTDMLLQRIGRLQRHDFGDRVHPECVILSHRLLGYYDSKLTGNNLVSQYMNAVQGGAYVYDLYILRRSYSIWKNVDSLSLPLDIRKLLEMTYSDCEVYGIDAEFKRIHKASVITQTTSSKQSLSMISGVMNDDIGNLIDDGTVHGTRRIITRTHSIILVSDILANNVIQMRSGESIVLSDRMSLDDRIILNHDTVKVSEGIRNNPDIHSVTIGKHDREYLLLKLDSDGLSVPIITNRTGSLMYTDKKGLFRI